MATCDQGALARECGRRHSADQGDRFAVSKTAAALAARKTPVVKECDPRHSADQDSFAVSKEGADLAAHAQTKSWAGAAGKNMAQTADVPFHRYCSLGFE